MHNPEDYEKYIAYQPIDAKHCLENYKSKMNLKNGCRVIDLGSGNGSTTSTILKEILPKDFRELIGVDISDKMVNFANEKYSDERTKFQVMDISGDLSNDFRGRFDLVFCSYVYHFIDGKKLFKNIFDLLVSGGTCALVFHGRHPFYDVYTAMAKQSKWQRNMDNFVTKYHYMSDKDTENELKCMAKEIGYSIIEVECKEVTYTLKNLDFLKNMVRAANCFNITLDKIDQFLDEFVQLSLEVNAVKRSLHSEEVIISYGRIEVFGQK